MFLLIKIHIFIKTSVWFWFPCHCCQNCQSCQPGIKIGHVSSFTIFKIIHWLIWTSVLLGSYFNHNVSAIVSSGLLQVFFTVSYLMGILKSGIQLTFFPIFYPMLTFNCFSILVSSRQSEPAADFSWYISAFNKGTSRYDDLDFRNLPFSFLFVSPFSSCPPLSLISFSIISQFYCPCLEDVSYQLFLLN